MFCGNECIFSRAERAAHKRSAGKFTQMKLFHYKVAQKSSKLDRREMATNTHTHTHNTNNMLINYRHYFNEFVPTASPLFFDLYTFELANKCSLFTININYSNATGHTSIFRLFMRRNLFLFVFNSIL